MDLDHLDFDMTITEDSQRSSILSPHSSQLSGSAILSQQTSGGLLIPPSASSFIGGPVGGFGSFGIWSDSGAGTRLGSGNFQRDENEGLLDDDLGLVVQDDGTMIMQDAPLRQPRGPMGRSERTDMRSDATGATVRHDHEAGSAAMDIVGPVH